MILLSHKNITTGKTIALTRWTFVYKVMSLLFNMLSRLAISFMANHIVGCIRLLDRYRNQLIDFQIININGKEHL